MKVSPIQFWNTLQPQFLPVFTQLESSYRYANMGTYVTGYAFSRATPGCSLGKLSDEKRILSMPWEICTTALGSHAKCMWLNLHFPRNLLQGFLTYYQLLDCGCDATHKPFLSNALMALADSSVLQPTSLFLPKLATVEKIGQPLFIGGFGHISKGLFEGKSVAIKIGRISSKDELADIWRVRLRSDHRS